MIEGLARRIGLILASGLLVAGLVWTLRAQILRPTGISLDIGDPAETALRLPASYRSGVFASGLAGPRFMALAPDGTLVVAERGADRVVALPDRDGDGRADETMVVGSGYDAAHSVAFEASGTMLVAGTTRVARVTLGPGLRERAREVIVDGLPRGGHETRTVLARGDGFLLSVGSSCDVCFEEDRRRAAVLHYAPDGTGGRVVMAGLRNAVGLAADPATGRVWATVMGRDRLGDDLPPETLYEIVQGADAGWPRCHAGTIVDPEFGSRPDPASGAVGCAGVAAPAATFQAHSAPLGLAVWRGYLVIAFHGSWNSSRKVGYELRRLPWAEGPTGASESFADGFLDRQTERSTGRPAGLIVGADDALYLSDDKAGYIYRITGP